MKIYVARHGETDYNSQELGCGVSDIPLNEKGLKQAERLAEVTARYPHIGLMIVSPLARARQTAECILRRCPMELRIDDRLREQDYGVFEGKKKGKEFHAAVREFAKPCPGGESLFHVAQRVYNFLDELIRDQPAGEVLLLTHGAVSRVIRSYFVPMGNEEYMGFLQKKGELAVYEAKR